LVHFHQAVTEIQSIGRAGGWLGGWVGVAYIQYSPLLIFSTNYPTPTVDKIRPAVAEIFFNYYFEVNFHWGHLQSKDFVDFGLVPLASAKNLNKI
jgi:hypothetical protein